MENGPGGVPASAIRMEGPKPAAPTVRVETSVSSSPPSPVRTETPPSVPRPESVSPALPRPEQTVSAPPSSGVEVPPNPIQALVSPDSVIVPPPLQGRTDSTASELPPTPPQNLDTRLATAPGISPPSPENIQNSDSTPVSETRTPRPPETAGTQQTGPEQKPPPRIFSFDTQDYYKVLGLPPNATYDEIRSAFREGARKYHPDSQSPDADTEKFLMVQEAWNVLSNTEKRARYDSIVTTAQTVAGLTEEYASPADIIRAADQINSLPQEASEAETLHVLENLGNSAFESAPPEVRQVAIALIQASTKDIIVINIEDKKENTGQNEMLIRLLIMILAAILTGIGAIGKAAGEDYGGAMDSFYDAVRTGGDSKTIITRLREIIAKSKDKARNSSQKDQKTSESPKPSPRNESASLSQDSRSVAEGSFRNVDAPPPASRTTEGVPLPPRPEPGPSLPATIIEPSPQPSPPAQTEVPQLTPISQSTLDEAKANITAAILATSTQVSSPQNVNVPLPDPRFS